jgi:hypothetical protein
MWKYCDKCVKHTYNYFFENLTCLTYGLEILVYKYLINFTYYDLLVDISESFGIWIVLFILLTSSLLVSVLIHQYSSNTKNNLNNTTSESKTNEYKTFLKFITLPKNKL